MTPLPFAAPVARVLLRSQSDERLVKLARDGHQGAFDEIVRRYRTPLVAFAASYAPSAGAEDVVQDSFANAWVSLQNSEREIALKPWLYTIVRNRSLNARRDIRYHEELDETIDGVRRPDEIVLQRDELSRAVAAVAALPDAQRKALVDSAIEGRTHDQIAAELGTTAGSVRGLIHRGRVTARGALGSVVPLPLVAWATGPGAAASGLAAGSAVGGSLATKGVAVAAIAVLATGSGIVVERSLDDSAKSDREAGAAEGPRPGTKNAAAERNRSDGDDPVDTSASTKDDQGEGDPGQERGDEAERDRGEDRAGGDGDEDEGGEDNSGPGSIDDEGEDDNSGPGSESSGHGGGGDSESDDFDDGGSSGSGSGSSGGDDDSLDSGSSGSGSSGSGSSSPGSDSSGSGSDFGEGGDSSGSGSGDDGGDD